MQFTADSIFVSLFTKSIRQQCPNNYSYRSMNAGFNGKVVLQYCDIGPLKMSDNYPVTFAVDDRQMQRNTMIGGPAC